MPSFMRASEESPVVTWKRRCFLYGALALLLGGCAQNLVSNWEVPCVTIDYHSGITSGHVLKVELYSSGLIRFQYGGLVQRTRVRSLVVERLCRQLGSFDTARFSGMLLEGRESGHLGGSFEVLEISIPPSSKLVVDLWNEAFPELRRTEFGAGMRLLDRILRDRFSRAYCVGEKCQWTMLGNWSLHTAEQ